MKPRILDRLIDLVSQSFSRSPGQPRAERRRAKRLTQLCHALLSERGEVSGARLAREALAAWQGLDAESSQAFFDVLAEEFSPDPDAILRCAVEQPEADGQEQQHGREQTGRILLGHNEGNDVKENGVDDH